MSESLDYIHNKLADLDNRLVEMNSHLESRIDDLMMRVGSLENDVSNKADTYDLDDKISSVRSDLESLEHKVDYS